MCWPGHSVACLWWSLDFESILVPGQKILNWLSLSEVPICEIGKPNQANQTMRLESRRIVHCKSGALGMQNTVQCFYCVVFFYNSDS